LSSFAFGTFSSVMAFSNEPSSAAVAKVLCAFSLVWSTIWASLDFCLPAADSERALAKEPSSDALSISSANAALANSTFVVFAAASFGGAAWTSGLALASVLCAAGSGCCTSPSNFAAKNCSGFSGRSERTLCIACERVASSP